MSVDAKALARKKIQGNRRKKKQIYNRRVKIQNQHSSSNVEIVKSNENQEEDDDDENDENDDDENDDDDDDEDDDEDSDLIEQLRLEAEQRDAHVRQIAIAHAAKVPSGPIRTVDPLDTLLNDRHQQQKQQPARSSEPPIVPQVDKKELNDWLDDIQ
jgi:hypothetical protein